MQRWWMVFVVYGLAGCVAPFGNEGLGEATSPSGPRHPTAFDGPCPWTSQQDEAGLVGERCGLKVATRIVRGLLSVEAIDEDAPDWATISLRVEGDGFRAFLSPLRPSASGARLNAGEWHSLDSLADGRVATGAAIRICAEEQSTNGVEVGLLVGGDALTTSVDALPCRVWDLVPIPCASDVTKGIPACAQDRVLVDATRDGGTWWFPQHPGQENPLLYRQGEALVDNWSDKGRIVSELPRHVWIEKTVLFSHEIVVRTSSLNHLGEDYADAEIAAYLSYVEAGGRLLLVQDHMRHDKNDRLAEAFGMNVSGTTPSGARLIFDPGHPLTAGVGDLHASAGSCVTQGPADAKIAARYASDVFCDMDDDRVWDPSEPSGAVFAGTFEHGEGRVVFVQDMNLLEEVPQPLMDNILAFLSP